MNIGEHRHCCATLISKYKDFYGKKPIVSVTYENESISIKTISPYIKCVLRLSCVVHEVCFWISCSIKKNPTIRISIFQSQNIYFLCYGSQEVQSTEQGSWTEPTPARTSVTAERFLERVHAKNAWYNNKK